MLKIVSAGGGRERGFSLIEALIAMVILLLASLAMLSVVPFGFNNVETNSIQVQAVAVGQQYLDDERNAELHSAVMPTVTTAPIDPGHSFLAGSVSNSNYGNFTITPDGCATVQNAGTSANVYSCSVIVSWTQSGASRTTMVQSYVTK